MFEVIYFKAFEPKKQVLTGTIEECKSYADEENLLLAEQDIKAWTENYYVQRSSNV